MDMRFGSCNLGFFATHSDEMTMLTGEGRCDDRLIRLIDAAYRRYGHASGLGMRPAARRRHTMTMVLLICRGGQEREESDENRLNRERQKPFDKRMDGEAGSPATATLSCFARILRIPAAKILPFTPPGTMVVREGSGPLELSRGFSTA